MNRRLQIWGLLGFLGAVTFCSSRLDAATINVACPGQSLQAAVDAAQSGDIIQVSGACNENILVRNEKQRLTIQGTGMFPGINGPDANLPTINVRGKGILIQGLIIVGGGSGVHVNRGSNAVINLTIIDSNVYGIRVDQQSFAVITNSTIADNFYGIFVDESSTARVGYNLDTETSASPNTIQANFHGIHIQGASNARIAGNTISESSQYGIVIRGGSHVVIGGNNIGNNSSSGVSVSENSSARMGSAIGGPSFINAGNNSNAGSNGGYGVQCDQGGLVSGSIGTLTGTSGAKSVVAPCQDLL